MTNFGFGTVQPGEPIPMARNATSSFGNSFDCADCKKHLVNIPGPAQAEIDLHFAEIFGKENRVQSTKTVNEN